MASDRSEWDGSEVDDAVISPILHQAFMLRYRGWSEVQWQAFVDRVLEASKQAKGAYKVPSGVDDKATEFIEEVTTSLFEAWRQDKTFKDLMESSIMEQRWKIADTMNALRILVYHVLAPEELFKVGHPEKPRDRPIATVSRLQQKSARAPMKSLIRQVFEKRRRAASVRQPPTLDSSRLFPHGMSPQQHFLLHGTPFGFQPPQSHPSEESSANLQGAVRLGQSLDGYRIGIAKVDRCMEGGNPNDDDKTSIKADIKIWRTIKSICKGDKQLELDKFVSAFNIDLSRQHLFYVDWYLPYLLKPIKDSVDLRTALRGQANSIRNENLFELWLVLVDDVETVDHIPIHYRSKLKCNVSPVLTLTMCSGNP